MVNASVIFLLKNTSHTQIDKNDNAAMKQPDNRSIICELANKKE